MTVATPAFTPVTFPFTTVATLVSLLFHVSVLLVAVVGFIVAVRVSLPPTSIVVDVLFKLTDVTAISSPFTVISIDFDIFPAVAVIVAVPGFLAYTTPFPFTDATDNLLLFQEIVLLSVVSLGMISALSVVFSPGIKLVVGAVIIKSVIGFFFFEYYIIFSPTFIIMVKYFNCILTCYI